MTKVTKIVAISGSLRKASYNTAAIKAAMTFAPENCEIELLEISKIPLYDQELADSGTPEAVLTLAKKIHAADAIIFATPEYNYSISGVLKNTIDWLSRQQPQPFEGKPAAIITASMSFLGGARAHYHLRQIMIYLDVHFINKPEVMIASAHEKFDNNGQLTDNMTGEFLQQLVSALVTWSDKINS
ncbi:NAD(P)H-dependent oxidoreductase [Colwellia sp. M166]|uniref:NADPH-dependent FMN reductase n=1 Tax=Colwellia sp. M166 TaxID=2583805 RepID=UPI00211E9BDC|nr:NAD(P)H-dependent oxidoreductase [Colwellia sp. M166]UUO23605.1 NAD(P)H-dependent oxidoreductase [Colwellia sp. M166]|tara:strand:+ start:42634 stop:43191 length:558 start_codon:yes stop_codon:yes gene_type:complete